MSDEATKPCPVCGETILAVAVKCRYCGEYLDPQLKRQQTSGSAVDRMLAPVGRPVSAIAAGYLAMFSIVPAFGFFAALPAALCGFHALRKIKQDPSLTGKGRAWFGIIMGVPLTLLWGILLVVLIVGAIQESAN